MVSTTRNHRRWIDGLKNRWPTALAIGPWVLTLGGGEADGAVGGMGEALLLLL